MHEESKERYLEDLFRLNKEEKEERKGFLLKVNTEQFRKLFPKRENSYSSIGDSGVIVIDTIPIPEDCILCDYGCNKNLVNEEFFYLFIVDKDLCQGTVCKNCYERNWRRDNLPIKEFEEVFS